MENPVQTTPEKIPSVYILVGDDIDAIEETKKEFIRMVGDNDFSAMNITFLEGSNFSLDEMANSINLFPMGAKRRLVICRDFIGSIRADKDIERFLKLLKNAPPTTALVLLLVTEWGRKKKEWGWIALLGNNWFSKWINEKKEDIYYKELRKPNRNELPNRIRKIVEEENGKIENNAIAALIQITGDDLSLARMEINKLLNYVNFERSVTREDVGLICKALPEENIFAMVDAFATGDSQKTLHNLKILHKSQPYPVIFSMLVRQFRLLLLTKELLLSGEKNVLNVNGINSKFVATKMTQQSKRFTFDQLKQIYKKLYLQDSKVKKGIIPADNAIELFFLNELKNVH